jgi:alpha-tubulin suppressor-like RCC1 family protein
MRRIFSASAAILVFCTACGGGGSPPSAPRRVVGLPTSSPSTSASTPAAEDRSPLRVTHISLGARHACLRTAAGEIWCWGDGEAGQLGGGTRLRQRKTPTLVPLSERALSIHAQQSHICAALEGGRVACWGSNAAGELGHGTKGPPSFSPHIATVDGVSRVVTGPGRTFVLRRDGTVVGWGANPRGQLGDGTENDSLEPRAVRGMTNVVELTAGEQATFALQRDGRVFCWGMCFVQGATRAWAQRDATAVQRLRPTPVPSLIGVRHLVDGCAVLNDGTVRCWDRGGALGDGITSARRGAFPIPGATRVAAVAVGSDAACAVQLNGRVQCWGNGESGLFPGAPERFHGTAVDTNLAGVASLELSSQFACALLNDGTVACWGDNRIGTLGDGTFESRRDPVPISGFGNQDWVAAPAPVAPDDPPAPAMVVEIAAGGDSTCSRHADGTARCWGQNDEGQVGDGTRMDRLRPTPVVGLTGIVQIATSGLHSCARLDSGTVRCWGTNLSGETGNGVASPGERIPVPVQGLEHVEQLALAGISCARLSDRTVRCWGDWEPGDEDRPSAGSLEPTEVKGATGLQNLAAGRLVACGRSLSGEVLCWGHCGARDLCTPGSPRRRASSIGAVFSAASVAIGSVRCAPLAVGEVQCWKPSDPSDVTGDRNRIDPWMALRVPDLVEVAEMALGEGIACARRRRGGVVCAAPRGRWERVPGVHDAVQVVAGTRHVCVRTSAGEVFCWGENTHGQLGDGTRTARDVVSEVKW